MKENIKHIVGTITPYLPYVGLLCGSVCVARHIWNKKTSMQKPEKTIQTTVRTTTVRRGRERTFTFLKKKSESL